MRQVKRHLVIVAERSWPERAEASELRMRFAVPRFQEARIAGIDQPINICHVERSRHPTVERLEIVSS